MMIVFQTLVFFSLLSKMDDVLFYKNIIILKLMALKIIFKIKGMTLEMPMFIWIFGCRNFDWTLGSISLCT